MNNLKENLSGLYWFCKKDNYNFSLSKEKLDKISNDFPEWLDDQIIDDFNFFFGKSNDIDGTIENFKKGDCLKSALLIKIIIKNNKFSYQNFLPAKFHPRFIRLRNYFNNVLKYVKFPDVEFLYSIHDSFENQKWLDLLKCPLFCISKLKGNNKIILFPHVEWTQKNEYLIKDICKAALHFVWNNKIGKAFWRGSITGHADLNLNERYKILKMASQYPDFFNVRLNSLELNKKNKKQLIKFLNKETWPPVEQLKYKYLLAIDGNAFPGSFFWQLFSNSLVFKNKSNYLEWYYSALNNNEHYVEFVNENDLLQKIQFFNHNDLMAKEISKNANSFAHAFLTDEMILFYILKLLEKYSSFFK